MPNDPTTAGNGPWRILVLDRDPTDPKWLLATVATPADVRAAPDIGAVMPGLDEATHAWATTASGLLRPVFTRLVHPEVWRIDAAVPHAE